MSTKPTINISIEPTKEGFTFCDNTSKFTASNPKGWKHGAWSINYVTSATIRLTMPNGESASLLVTDMPSLNCACRELTPLDFGVSEFESGKYKIEYVIVMSSSSIGATVIRTTESIYHLGKVKCCIEAKKKSICDYSTEKAKEIFFMDTLLTSVSLAACKGDETSANDILAYLNNKCNCKCC